MVLLLVTDSGHFVEMNEEDFLKEALTVVERAQAKGVLLRFLGAFAIYVHSLDNEVALAAYRSSGRLGKGKPLFTDLDLALYSKQRSDAIKILEQMGFKPDNMVNMMFGGRRLMYYNPQGKYPVDLFLDKLEYSHDVDFGKKPGSGRLDLDYPTITLADIVLEKLQIHQINRKDVLDLIVLLLGHDVMEEAQKDAIDGGYVSRILADDWGFWYDATNNLSSLVTLVQELARDDSGISDEHLSVVTGRAGKLRNMIDHTAKTKNWEKRSRIGTSKAWYREVGEVAR